MAINSIKAILNKLAENVSAKNQPVKDNKSDTGILKFGEREEIKNNEQQIMDEYLDLQENDPVTQKCNEIKEILNNNPSKDQIIKLAASYGTSVFKIIDNFHSVNGENLFDAIKNKFSKEDQKEIFQAMGKEAAFQILDSIEEREPIDTRGIINHVIGNLKNDPAGCEFAKSFLLSSSRIFDETIRLDSGIIEYIEKSSMNDEDKAKLTSKYYQQKLESQIKLYADAANINPNSKLIKQGSSNMCWQAATYNALMNTEEGKRIAEKLINNDSDSGSYSVNLGGQEIKITYKEILSKLGPSSPDLNATIMTLAFNKVYPEGTGVTGAFALGDSTSKEYSHRDNAGSLSTFLNQVDGNFDFQSFVRDKNPLNSSKINRILDKISGSNSEFAAVVNFYSKNDYTTIELSDYRDSDKKYKVANNGAHALTLKSADDKTVTLIDPQNPEELITITRKEFCEKVQLIEYCSL